MESRPAEPLILAFLQKAQQLRLRRQAHLADLVEEQHATRRHLDLSGFRLLRAGERAALVAEQLGLEQLFRERRAVDRDERTVAPRRCPMNQSGDHFLAGTRLALEKDGGLGYGDAHGRRHHTLPGRGRSDRTCRSAVTLYVS